MMMVAVALAVGRNMNQLRTLASVGKAAHQAIGKPFPIAQQAFKGDGLRDRSIIEKQIDSLFRRQPRAV